MSGGIYLLGDDDKLIEMKESQYDSESLLQELLAKYTNLLAGDQIDKEYPRKWLLITKEAPVSCPEGESGTWATDHLFIDQDGVPTIVEVKRSTDSGIRRKVVGQMLDYAANAVVFWSIDKIKAFHETNCQKQGFDADQALEEFLEEDSIEQFWNKVKTNLRAGKIRLIFVSDAIPYELQRIVEFLNEQMDPAEVLALEIKQYIGQNLKTMVPRVIGQTSEAQQKKSKNFPRWNKERFLGAIDETCSEEEKAFVRKALDWCKAQNLEDWWGTGQKIGSYIPVLNFFSERYTFFSLKTNKYVGIEFGCLNNRLPSGNEKILNELLNKLNELGGINFSKDQITKFPNIPLNIISREHNREKFFNIFEWFLDELKRFVKSAQ